MRADRLKCGEVDPPVGADMAAYGIARNFPLVPASWQAVTLDGSSVPGWRQVQFDEQSRILALPPGVRLDLGATAKAWAADRSAARLAAALGCGVLVSLGGDIAVAGETPPGGWRVRVQDVTGRPED